MSILENDIVKSELNRLESLIGTDDGRDDEVDIGILRDALVKIEKELFNENKYYVVVDGNMWEECHNSLWKILDEFNLEIDDNKSKYDYYEFAIKWARKDEYLYPLDYLNKLKRQELLELMESHGYEHGYEEFENEELIEQLSNIVK